MSENVKSKQICSEHHCDICGEDLVPRWANWILIIIMIFFAGAMLFSSWLVNRADNMSSCYIRQQISGTFDNGITKTQNVECPKE